jgi:Rha family phage regulatory protein
VGKLVLNPEFNLYEREGNPLCSSRQVAETFGKRHDHVMQTIREAIETTSSFAPEFSGANFFESRYKDRGKFYPEYLLTKDAFSYIVMGFTGKKAAAFKIAFIDRFNQMERFIKSLYAAKLEHPAFTEAVMLAHEEPKHYHFSNEADLINRLVLGVPAKGYREMHGIPSGQSIRPYLSEEDIRMVETLQRVDIGLLTAGLDFEQRKAVLLTALAKRRQALAG